MTNAEKLTLAKHACHMRMGVMGARSAECGHAGGSLDIADVLAYLYFVEIEIDAKAPRDTCRPRPFGALQGPCAPRRCMPRWLSAASSRWNLPTLRKIGSYLQGHPNMNSVPGVDMSTGSLGQGVSACGMALGAKAAQYRPSTSTPSWATARWKRASAGRRSCSPPLRPRQPLRHARPQPPADRRHHRDVMNSDPLERR